MHSPKKKPWHLRNLVLLFFQSLFYWSHPLRYENIYPCSFCPKIWISCAGSFTILFLYSRNSFQNNLDYSLLRNFPLLFVAPQNDVTNVLQHTPYSSAICINPWQMVGLCFHLWNSQFQVYWIGLHVKANCYTPRNLSCHILRVVWLIHQWAVQLIVPWLWVKHFTTWTVCTRFHPRTWMSGHYRPPPTMLIFSDPGYLLPFPISFETLQVFPWGKLNKNCSCRRLGLLLIVSIRGYQKYNHAFRSESK